MKNKPKRLNMLTTVGKIFMGRWRNAVNLQCGSRMQKVILMMVLALFCMALGLEPAEAAPVIVTVAGNGGGGYSGDGGAATSAKIFYPYDVAVDSSGNIYISDNYNNRIRKVNTSGVISTVAGNGTWGYSGDGGAATSSEIISPRGVAVDSFGNIYIADSYNNRIRKVDTSGVISTVAGNVTGGYSGDGGAATSAELNSPSGIAVDSSGNIYFADSGNNRIRKVNSSGVISTVAGNGTQGYSGDGGAATSAELNYPAGVAVDSSGNIYIATWDSRIRKVNSSGVISTVAGNGTNGYSGDGGAANSAELYYPDGIAVDSSGNIYIADIYNNRIRKVNSSGVISTVAGNGTGGYSGDGGAATSAELYYPYGIAVDSSGNIYIADSYNQRIRKVSSIVAANVASPSTVYGNQNFSGFSKDPVNTSTGNYMYSMKDFEIPGKGFPFSFTRYFNSQDNTDGPLGFGWGHTYTTALTVNADSSVTLRNGDGKQETWTSNGSGSYTAPNGVFDILTQNGDGSFTLLKMDLTRYTFNASGKLTTISDRNSNSITLAYVGTNLATITDTAGRNISFLYNGSNRITAVTDPVGRTLQFGYDGNGNLTSATDPNGNQTTYTYDSNHQMLTAVDPRGNTIVTNTYDASNRVVTAQRDAKMGQSTFTYDTTNQKTTIVDQLGNTTVHYYDYQLRLIQQVDPLGNSIYYTYDASGNRSQIIDKNGNKTTYTYDANGNVLTKTDALNNTTTITYDAYNNPLTRTDALGNITAYQYDANGNLIKTTDPLGNVSTQTCNPAGQPQTTTDARGKTTTNSYDSQGNLTQIVDPLGNTTTYTFDGVGRRLSKTDPLNHKTTFVYDGNGNLLRATDPLGNATSSTYDGNSNNVTGTDPLGNITSYSYDVKNLLTIVTDPAGKTLAYTYDALDRKISATDKNGNTTTNTYDGVGNLTQTTDALGNNTRYTYDANGNKTSETNPLGQMSSYTYDALNRLVTKQDPLANTTTTAYDAIGRIISSTNAKGQKTTFQFDAMSRLTQVNDAVGGMVQYTYDANGNRLTMKEPNGNVTLYAYDALNRLITETGPLGKSRQYVYDAAGNRIKATDANGAQMVYSYDAANRLTEVSYPDLSAVMFTLDANGNRKEMDDNSGTSTYSYDPLGRMISYSNPSGKTVGYGYDANGNRTSLTYPDGKKVTYTYDAANRLVTVTDWLSHVTTYSYDKAGKPVSTTNPNGTKATYGYDVAGRLTSLTNSKSDATVISSYAYTLDAIGNHASVAQTEPIAPQLPSSNVSYNYDAENRLTNVGGVVSTFDSNGNMTARGNNTFAYDFNNRLVQSSIGETTTTYSYDGQGTRLRKNSAGLTVGYIQDVNGRLANVLAETDGNNTITAYNVYGIGLISRILPNGTTSYYHYDSRGSAIALTDTSQNVTDSYVYNPFGILMNSNGTTNNPFKYVGRYGVMDDGNGIDYIRARYYSPDLGRFISRDPLAGKDGDGQSLNRYVYALNNPVRLIDVNGYSALEGSVSSNINNSSDNDHNNIISKIEIVTINFYDGVPGHIGISVNNGQSYGYYPQNQNASILLGNNVPGEEEKDTKTPTQQVTIKVTPRQADIISQGIDNLEQHPGDYNLYNNNCAIVVENLLKSAGIQNVPSNKDDIVPFHLIQDSQKLEQ